MDVQRVEAALSSCATVKTTIKNAAVIGTNETAELFKMVRNTGGYAFAPKTQWEFFQVFLLDTVVDIRTRPNIAKVARHVGPHPKLNSHFFALGDADLILDTKSWKQNLNLPRGALASGFMVSRNS
ncbi:hypothetical protein AJ80_04803 [Polytolypa hystricis UAMH7299]|uniref:Uncharacterized protein n=1 Tax=Polytolypa hystricis (strain UAMH7299) TaxID=1447883 RepID=A0A2B7Y8S3_POLH7|nr:hypothetical protein AJ80_04803 [Polytolypa hystricis UAMH7299]